MYINKDEVLRSSEVQIEGDWDIFANSDTTQALNELKNTEKPSKTVPDVPKVLAEDHLPLNPTPKNENPPNSTTVDSQAPNPPENEPVTTPNQPTRRNSLKGLQQFNSNEYGRGK